MNIVVTQAITNLGSGGPDDNEAQAGHLVTHALTADGFDASEDGTGRGTPIIPFDTTQITSKENRCNPQAGDPSHPLSATAHPPAIAGIGVRRLTPTECERLQGFPDGWTCLCDQEPCACPDGPRYRALGNAVTVPVIHWLGRQILAVQGSASRP